MKDEGWATLGLVIAVFLMVVFWMFIASIHPPSAHAHDMDHPELDGWYANLKQPDNPSVSCCGEADSYYCDEHARGAQIYCVVNDERDNEKLRRTPVPNGTEIEIPDRKLMRDPNLAGRAIVFLSSGGIVYCFIGASGS